MPTRGRASAISKGVAEGVSCFGKGRLLLMVTTWRYGFGMRRAPLALILAAIVSGCADEEQARPIRPRDPAIALALNDPLMTDPDLSQRNEGAAALTVLIDNGLPPLAFDADAPIEARAEATRLVGNSDFEVPSDGAPPDGGVAVRSITQIAADTGAPAQCLARMTRSAVWAARMPPELPIFPRGAVKAAAGAASPGCDLRAVRYVAPAPQADVAAFYWALSKKGGFIPRVVRGGETVVIDGRSGADTFSMRAHDSGELTVVELSLVSR